MTTSLKTFTVEDLKKCADALVERMKMPEYEETYKANVSKVNGPPQPQLLLHLMEKQQVDQLILIGYADGDKALEDLKGAVRRFPDEKELRASIVALCDCEEGMLERVQKARAKELGIQLMGPQQHQQMMMQMQQAMASLPPERQKRMQEISQKAMQGKPPTPEEQKYVAETQAHIRAYMETMQEMMKMQQEAGPQ